MDSGIGADAEAEAELREQKEAISKLLAKKHVSRSRSPSKDHARLRNGSANNLFDVSSTNGADENGGHMNGDDSPHLLEDDPSNQNGDHPGPEDQDGDDATDESGSVESIPASVESIPKPPPSIMQNDVTSDIDMTQVESAEPSSASEAEDNDLLDVSDDAEGRKCRNPTPALEGETNIIDAVLKEGVEAISTVMDEVIKEHQDKDAEIGETNLDDKEMFNASMISSDQESFETVKVVDDMNPLLMENKTIESVKQTFHDDDTQTPEMDTPAQVNARNQMYTLPTVLGYQADVKKSNSTLNKQSSDASDSEDDAELFKKHCKCDVIKKDPKVKTKVCNII